MNPLFDLSDRVAIVTGGNGGIGLGMAEGLAAAGARIAVVGRNAGKNQAAAERLGAMGTEVAAIEADVTQEADCRRMVEETADRFGRLDILINNAGTNERKAPELYTLAEWNGLITVNLTSAFLCSLAAYPRMQASGGGKIINIGSMMSLFGASFAAPYAAAKGGVVQMSKSLAGSWAKDNIQVNAVLPGWIDTDLTVEAKRQVTGLHERVLARTPAGRWGLPSDMAGIAVFLASRASDFVTGTAIPVDGGYASQA
ncbi:MAG: glucose 1-dehydrogenase [Rhizobiales bacterium]|nr:glucose 1-dehydrogenase [Hyphomicrobiales bacterium]